MKQENFTGSGELLSSFEWDEKNRTLTYTSFQNGKLEMKKVVTGCATFTQAKNFLTP